MLQAICKFKRYLKNGVLNDVAFKMIANIVLTITRNIMVLPIMAKIFTNSEYGEIVTIVGVITTIAAGFGNALLSTRLVREMDYKNAFLQGDFNLICIIVSGISILFTVLIALLFPNLSVSNLLFVAAILFAETFTGYHSGWFILRQAYKKLLIYTVIGSAGFVIGLLFSYFTKLWTLTYFTSDIICLTFLVIHSPLITEKLVLTSEKTTTIKKYIVLIITTIISNALAYLDRLLLYPILGGEAVAVYTTASMFGKIFSMISLPVSSIMLGYYATERIKLDLKKYWLINFLSLAFLIFFIIITQVAGIWFTGLLYPSIIAKAAPYVLIANLSSAIGASAQITKSAALIYAKTYWVLIIQAVYATVYIGVGYYAVKIDGLRGFTYSVLIANILQLVLLFIVCHIAVKNLNQSNLNSIRSVK